MGRLLLSYSGIYNSTICNGIVCIVPWYWHIPSRQHEQHRTMRSRSGQHEQRQTIRNRSRQHQQQQQQRGSSSSSSSRNRVPGVNCSSGLPLLDRHLRRYPTASSIRTNAGGGGPRHSDNLPSRTLFGRYLYHVTRTVEVTV